MHNQSRFSLLSLGAALVLTLALAAPALANFTYTVQPGDSLSKIARNNNVTLNSLIAANKAQFPCLATNPVCLQVGWVLSIPGSGGTGLTVNNPSTYTVVAGDSLSKIARKFGVTYSALLHANTAARPCLASQPACALQIGWTLTIPGGSQTLTTAANLSTPEATVRQYFAALNAHDFAGFKATLHPSLIAQSPDPDFDIQNIIEIIQHAQMQFQILSISTSSQTSDTAHVDLTERVNSPLPSINGYQISTTFTLIKVNGNWLVADEGLERGDLIP